MSYAKLKGKIKEYFDTQEAFAAAMDMNPATLSQKLNSKSEWSRAEVEKACRLLHITLIEIGEYFFTPKVEKTQHDEVEI